MNQEHVARIRQRCSCFASADAGVVDWGVDGCQIEWRWRSQLDEAADRAMV